MTATAHIITASAIAVITIAAMTCKYIHAETVPITISVRNRTNKAIFKMFFFIGIVLNICLGISRISRIK